MTQSREPASPSARWRSRRVLLEATWRNFWRATWCHSSCRSSCHCRLVHRLANRTILEDTRGYRSALKRRRTSNKTTISELRTTAGTGLSPIRFSAPSSGLAASGLGYASGAQTLSRPPIPASDITRSLIRKYRLHAQRKKDDRLRRSRNTLLPRNNRIQSASILNQSCVRDSHLESILLRLVLASETKPAGPQKGARHRHACA